MLSYQRAWLFALDRIGKLVYGIALLYGMGLNNVNSSLRKEGDAKLILTAKAGGFLSRRRGKL